MNRREYQQANTRLRKRIASGMTVTCLDCKGTEQVRPNRFYGGRVRCSACGGPVERVHPPRTERCKELDVRRKVPRSLGCPVRGQEANL